MFSSPVFALLGFYLSAAAAVEIQSFNPSFASAGIQGCIATTENADGAPLIIHNCNTESTENQDWFLSFYDKEPAGPQPITIFGGEKCIDVTNGVNADGTPLQIWTCVPGSTNQQWISVQDNTLQWAGTNKCIDLTNGLITDGNVLQIWTCTAHDENQAWTGASEAQPDASVAANIYGGLAAEFCITPASNADGAQVAVATCGNFATTFPNGNITWEIPNGTEPGSISTYGGTKCLDVTNGSTANGVKLQIWDCVAGNTNQMWTVKDGNPSQIEWNGTGKCIDLTDGESVNGNLIQLWDCTDADSNQVWYHTPIGN